MTEEQAAFHFGEPPRACGEAAAAPPVGDRRRLAYHEAGHAVAAHALGWRIVGLTLDESGGCCYSRPPIRVRPRPLSEAELERDRRRARARVLWADVTITLAGMMAERIATGDVHPRALPEEERAARLASAYTGRWQAFVERSRWSARQVLRRDWAGVEALAEALLAGGEVDGTRAREILAATLPHADCGLRIADSAEESNPDCGLRIAD